MYETIRAGPAVLRAASPVATKMPAPMTAPMPKAVSVTGPSARFSRLSLSMSASSVFSDLVANSWRRDIRCSGSVWAVDTGPYGWKCVVKYGRRLESVRRRRRQKSEVRGQSQRSEEWKLLRRRRPGLRHRLSGEEANSQLALDIRDDWTYTPRACPKVPNTHEVGFLCRFDRCTSCQGDAPCFAVRGGSSGVFETS